MKKLLITGCAGMLGSNIVLELKEKYDIIGLCRNQPNPLLKDQFRCDLTKYRDIPQLVGRIKPDFIIHCAALTDVEKCEGDYSLARETNAIATKGLISGLDSNVKFIYISTDSVFDGRKGNYAENDLPSPLNNYARSKLEGEEFVKRCTENYIILRTNIFGWNRVKGLSFAEWIIDNLKQRSEISMFRDVIFSPITVNTLSILIDKLLRIDFTGKLNIGSNSSISKYDFGVRLAGLFGLEASFIKPVSVDTFAFKAKRPKNTSLNVSKANAILGTLPTVEEELIKFYNEKRKKREAFYSDRKA